MKPTIGLICLGALLIATTASAHHAFAVEFDAKQCADVTGVLTRYNYDNPHAYLYLNLGEDGKGEEATFQPSSTSNLRRGGATPAVFNANIGKTVVVRGCASRNGEKNRYAASFVKLSDGTIQRVGQDVEGVFGTKIWR
jgi:hypothetical protein